VAVQRAEGMEDMLEAASGREATCRWAMKQWVSRPTEAPAGGRWRRSWDDGLSEVHEGSDEEVSRASSDPRVMEVQAENCKNF
jgi:hypothetical protein